MPIPAKVQGQAVWGFGEPGLIHWSQTIHEIWNFTFNITAQNHCKIGALNFQKIGLYSIYILAAWLGLHFSIFTANTGRKFFLLNAIYCEVCQKQIFRIGFKMWKCLHATKMIFFAVFFHRTFVNKLIHDLISEGHGLLGIRDGSNEAGLIWQR